jgi:hypothetical protein
LLFEKKELYHLPIPSLHFSEVHFNSSKSEKCHLIMAGFSMKEYLVNLEIFFKGMDLTAEKNFKSSYINIQVHGSNNIIQYLGPK